MTHLIHLFGQAKVVRVLLKPPPHQHQQKQQCVQFLDHFSCHSKDHQLTDSDDWFRWKINQQIVVNRTERSLVNNLSGKIFAHQPFTSRNYCSTMCVCIIRACPENERKMNPKVKIEKLVTLFLFTNNWKPVRKFLIP